MNVFEIIVQTLKKKKKYYYKALFNDIIYVFFPSSSNITKIMIKLKRDLVAHAKIPCANGKKCSQINIVFFF